MTDGRWLLFVHSDESLYGGTAALRLSEAGYRGATWHATETEAKAEGERILRAVMPLHPSAGWVAVYVCPWIRGQQEVEDCTPRILRSSDLG